MSNTYNLKVTSSELSMLLNAVQEEIIYFESRPQLAFRNTILKDLKDLENKIKGAKRVREM